MSPPAKPKGENSRGAVFVLSHSTSGQQGPVAAWVSTAGWVSAARRSLGAAWMATPVGLVEPRDARWRGSHPQLKQSSTTSFRRRIPTVAKTATKDLRHWSRSRRFKVDPEGPWTETNLEFVWQRHDLFHSAGLDLAEELQRPAVLFVPALMVRESTQWGVRRPGWNGWLERLGEHPALKRADLVACGSDLVADQVRQLGVPDSRILVTPTGVDLDLFADRPDPKRLRRRLRLTDRFVVGWVGSFRRFHALEQLIEAAADIEDVTLLFVGDGPERARIRNLARRRGVPARFTGTVPYADLPDYLATMDVATVLAHPQQPFHYSPLKLGEYLASGLPVVAPDTAQLHQRLTPEHDALLVPPGDPGALGEALRRLHDEPSLRDRLGVQARRSAQDQWSWDLQVERVTAALH